MYAVENLNIRQLIKSFALTWWDRMLLLRLRLKTTSPSKAESPTPPPTRNRYRRYPPRSSAGCSVKEKSCSRKENRSFVSNWKLVYDRESQKTWGMSISLLHYSVKFNKHLTNFSHIWFYSFILSKLSVKRPQVVFQFSCFFGPPCNYCID